MRRYKPTKNYLENLPLQMKNFEVDRTRTHTRTHAHTNTHTRTHTHAHTHTETQKVSSILALV